LVATLYLSLFSMLLVGVALVYLVADFGDRLNIFLNKPWAAVLTLYWNKSLVAVHQLAPAAMLLAASATVTLLRRRHEWTAIQSVGGSRWTVVTPIVACSVGLAALLVGFDEWVVTRAGERVDQMMVHTFGRWGDYSTYYFPKKWFRVGNVLVHLRGQPQDDGSLPEVTLFFMDERFRLTRRADAALMRAVGSTSWELREVTRRTFSPQGQLDAERLGVWVVDLPGSTPDSFAIRQGRPELMPAFVLLEQHALRSRVGLAGAQQYLLALHNRFALPLTGAGAALFALSLALRPHRKGYLTQALFEGLLVSATLFTFTIVSRGLVLAEHLPAAIAAWTPMAVMIAGAVSLWWHDEGAPFGRALL
jgi:lipopolysaccharide export system permease protein